MSARHSWRKEFVDVPWSSIPWPQYTCTKCGMTRISTQDAGGWFREFGIPQPDGSFCFVGGNTPPCEPQERAA